MEIREIKEVLEAKVWVGEDRLDKKVYAACGCDLMSDVLAFAKEKVLLLTGLVNPQVIRTAEMLDIKAIVFVRGKVPTEDMVALAKEKSIVLLSTHYHLYSACGKLYEKGLGGGGEE
nr:hypothetical protein [uncultured Niameybacter sp.]